MLKTSFAIFTAGFALFAMFFGSGNLVFPLLVGTKTGADFSIGSIGLIITGVLVPFIGLVSIVMYHQTPRQYFNRVGKPISFVIIFIMLALLGPFGVCPRCILVAYGGLSLLFDSLSLVWFSLFFCILGSVLIYYDELIIPLIGKYLTPILLATVICVIGFGVYYAGSDIPSNIGDDAFTTGLHLGYQPMDLLAAFFFAASISKYLTDCYSEKMVFSAQTMSIIACVVGAVLLGCIYFFFVKLGASYSVDITQVPPEQMLAKIAQLTLGKAALPVIAVLIFLACLTTFMILMDLFSTFLHEDILKENISPFVSIGITALIAFSVSLLGFGELASILAKLLFFIYPALIVFAVLSIFESILKIRMVKVGFYLALGIIVASKAIV